MKFLLKLISLPIFAAFVFAQNPNCREYLYEQWPDSTVLNLLSVPPCYGQIPIIGKLFYIQAGTFVQGSETDPCGLGSNFTHTLTRDFLMMETEVSRQMWEDLKLVQPDLPDDPTNLAFGSGLDNPVQNVTWYEAILFANLFSLERGRTRCYYSDAALTTPIDAANYTGGSYYCDFDANGFRLPTEGEWEYATRASTSGPFSIDEPNYTEANCPEIICTPMTFPNLESVAHFCANNQGETMPIGTLEPNPWGLKDVHGNVSEWCWDPEGAYPTAPMIDYTGPQSSPNGRSTRGGQREYRAGWVRSGMRFWAVEGTRGTSRGFRLVKTFVFAQN